MKRSLHPGPGPRWPAACLLALAACAARPTPESVRADFLAVHPTYEVVEIETGRGDGFNHYVGIWYRVPGDPYLARETWLYQEIDGAWTNTFRESSGVVPGPPPGPPRSPRPPTPP